VSRMRPDDPTAYGARSTAVEHGGPDALGVPAHDFSTNANAAGPLSSVWRAVQAADRTRYPDPAYASLRAQLADWHGVTRDRLVIAGSASEFIARCTRFAARRGARAVQVPLPGYGDYAHAAAQSGLSVRAVPPGGSAPDADLCWTTWPHSPSGALPPFPVVMAGGTAEGRGRHDALHIVDLAYQPLRLDDGDDGSACAAGVPDGAWQLWSPNKSCGLTGVRGAYAIAPEGDEALATRLVDEAPSWVLGADGVALLQAWAQPAAARELAGHRRQLSAWTTALRALLAGAGWELDVAVDAQGGALRSVCPFFVARPPVGTAPHSWRATYGVKLRDTGSMGLPGAWRLSAQSPGALAALARCVRGG